MHRNPTPRRVKRSQKAGKKPSPLLFWKGNTLKWCERAKRVSFKLLCTDEFVKNVLNCNKAAVFSVSRGSREQANGEGRNL